MAEIRVLPVRSVDPDQIDRLLAELIAARELGLDLGPRGPHIQTIGATLQSLTEQLEPILARLHRELRLLELEDLPALELISGYLIQVQQLAEKAQHFPDNLEA